MQHYNVTAPGYDDIHFWFFNQRDYDMAIRLIDAVDSMGNGGYIDLLQDRYIPPKWFSELCEENNSGFTAEDYVEFDRDPVRYLKPPIIRVTAVWGLTALRMGITMEQLSQCGMGKKEYWEVFLARQADDNEHYCYRYSDAEESAIHAIENLMLSKEQYNLFMRNKNEVLCEIVTEWMQEHDIHLVE